MMNMMKPYKKAALLLASVVFVLTLGAVGTLAILVDSAEPVENVFTPSAVPPTVVEVIDGAVKEKVTIENSGNVPAYIRAMITATWVYENGNIYGGAVPVLGTDYSYNIGSDWTEGADGYYYYKGAVAAGGQTNPLFTKGKVEDTATVPSGCKLSIEILAQTIQADGVDSDDTKPVVQAWGVNNGGSVEGVNDGTLSIKKPTTN